MSSKSAKSRSKSGENLRTFAPSDLDCNPAGTFGPLPDQLAMVRRSPPQASFTISVLDVLAHRLEHLATMPFASRTGAGIHARASRDRGTAGSTSERVRRPRPHALCHLCMTGSRSPPIEPSSMGAGCRAASISGSSPSASGFMKRASAIVSDRRGRRVRFGGPSRPTFPASLVPDDNSATCLPWRTMRPLPTSR